MAQWLEAVSASLAQGSKVINVTGSVDCSFVASSTAVIIDDHIMEAVSGSAPDTSGRSTITLRHTWSGTAISNKKLNAFNTIEGLRDAIQKARTNADQLATATTALNAATKRLDDYIAAHP